MSKANAGRAIRYEFIRLVYLLTAILGTSTGLLILLAPRIARRVLGMPSQLPEQDPIVFGLVGAIWLGVALTSLLGLRAPLKFLPLILLQLVYKSLWFVFVFTPLMLRGEFPVYGITIAVGNALWIALDLRALPFHYLLSKDAVVRQTINADSEESAPRSSSRVEAVQ